ncbi:MAG: hypothetical protein BWY09_00276 [Candidatus Hydrogenedentes bacterium ADurb.Bin179]|nr:MAG: hypothetical protein BWY09_00276 [Candidatus Hydrogenedentes bacterium ADurb.Bin179]
MIDLGNGGRAFIILRPEHAERLHRRIQRRLVYCQFSFHGENTVNPQSAFPGIHKRYSVVVNVLHPSEQERFKGLRPEGMAHKECQRQAYRVFRRIGESDFYLVSVDGGVVQALQGHTVHQHGRFSLERMGEEDRVTPGGLM